jgi:hypothetical protein
MADGLIDFEILIELTAFPFHSVRTLAGTLKIPRSTVWDHLQKGRFVVKHLRWVPHILDTARKQTRVTMAEGLLRDLQQARHQGWRSFLTGDESWFFYVTDFERIWVHEGQMLQSRPRTIISTQKGHGFNLVVGNRFPSDHRASPENQLLFGLFL